MRARWIAALVAAAGLLGLPAAAVAGGWATVSLSSTPDGLGPGQPWVVELEILQHGRTPLDGVEPSIVLTERRDGQDRAVGHARPRGCAPGGLVGGRGDPSAPSSRGRRLSRPARRPACSPSLALALALARRAARRRRVPRRQRRARLRGQGERLGRDPAAPQRGGSARRLAAPGKPADPAFSPLGRRIAFCSRSEIWVMYEDGTSVRQVTVGPEPSRDPSWSPAADALAFTTGYAGDRDLYSVGADGNRLRQLTTGGGDDEAPAWGPAGAIAFVRDGDVYLKAPKRRARAADRRRGRRPRPRLVARRPPDRLHAPAERRPRRRRARASKRKRPAPRLRELWVMRANGEQGAPAEEAARRRLRPRLVARRALDRVRDGPLRPPRALHDPQHRPRRCARSRSRAADPRAIDWQPRGGDPVIAAAGDIACDPDLTRFAHRPRHARRLPHAADLRPADEDGPVGDPAARRPAVRGRHAGQVPALVRPDLGPPEGPDAPGRRQPRVPHAGRRGLLRLLQRPRRLRRPGRPARQGLLLLRPRRLARRDAQLAVLAPARRQPVRERLRGRLAAGAVAARGPRRPPGALHARRLAPPAGSARASRAATTRSSRCSRRSTTAASTSCSPATTTATSASRRWTPPPTATAPAACASSWSARAARTRSTRRSPSPTARSARTPRSAC